jgi:sugar phosphate isomerase/epimerase
MPKFSRRRLIESSAVLGLGLVTSPARSAPVVAPSPAVRFCLNTSTLRGQNLSLEQEIEIASQCGYDGIEPWIREIESFRATGKPLEDLRKKISDSGLHVESAIGFAPWIVDDKTQREAGLEQLKRDMDLVARLGGTRIAAPPMGANQANAPKIDLLTVADRYRAILEIGTSLGVIPQVEVWGSSKNLSRLGDAVFVAVESGHPAACILPDVYHIYKGGSSFEGLKLLSAAAIQCFHFNDYPAQPSRAELNDSFRVYPGDGIAPWERIIRILKENRFAGVISLELFNKEYWAQDPRQVAETGLKKIKAVFASA